jgi:hypothetical protein
MSRARAFALAIGVVAVGTLFTGSLIQATPGSGTVSTLIGRGTFEDRFKVKRTDRSIDWEVEVEAKPDLDIAVQTIDFAIDAQSGWHSHPGPVFISVVQGTMTFYDSNDPNCEPTIRSAGEGFLDVGDHAHLARNESGAPARNVVVYLAPRAAALRVDQPNPGNCAFKGF